MFEQTRYNILLIVIDALRPDHLGCYGYRRDISPAIDRIAHEGVLFENTISQSSWTKPAVASLLTGTYPETHGVKGIMHSLPNLDSYVPPLLQQIGYRTACIQTNPFLSVDAGFGRGFDHYLELFDTAPGMYKPRVTEALAALSSWVDQPNMQPFFLYLHLLDTHNPYAPPEEFQRFGKEEEALYDAEVAFVDYHVSLIRDMLLKKGLYEKTALIITADHGEEFFEHGTKYHAKNLYQEVLRVPLIIAAPGTIEAESSVPSQVRSIDLAPTILEIAGLPVTEQHQGISLVDHLQRDTMSDLPAISQIGDDHHGEGLNIVAISNGKFKLIVDNQTKRRELYHLETDPHERCNRVDQHDEIAQHLESQVTSLLAPSAGTEQEPALKVKRPPTKTLTLDDHVMQQLRGLGYIE